MNIAIGDGLEITEIRVWPVRKPRESRIKAFGDITFNETLRAVGLRIIEGSHGHFLSWPTQKKVGSDEWISLVFPVSRMAEETIETAVLNHWKDSTTPEQRGED